MRKDTLRERVEASMLSKVKKGFSKNLNKEYLYIPPSRIHHHQWFWDSSFHAIIMSRNYGEIAKKELESLVSVQQGDGFIPHVIFWEKIPMHGFADVESNPKVSKAFTAYIQPPVLPFSTEIVFERTQDFKFLERMFEPLKKYIDYLSEKRDPDKDGLISIIMSRESGLDCSPIYDEVYGADYPESQVIHNELLKKYREWDFDLKKIFKEDLFNVEDLAVNSIYYLSLNSMANMALKLGEKKLHHLYRDMAARTAESILKKCWDEEERIFYSLAGKDERMLRVKTVESLLPIVLDDLGKDYTEPLVNEHILNEKEFMTPWPVPSVAVNEKSFKPHGAEWERRLEKLGVLPVYEFFSRFEDTNWVKYILGVLRKIKGEDEGKMGLRDLWRGQTWINTNYFIYLGLKKHGYEKLASYIGKKSRELVRRYGLREFYDSMKGRGGGARNFGWSGLVVEM